MRIFPQVFLLHLGGDCMITNGKIWIGVFLIGLFMGLLTHADRNNNKIQWPKKLKGSLNMGFVLDMFWGGIGAVVMVLLAGSTDMPRIILMGIIGGAAGQNLVMSLVRRYAYDKDEKVQDIFDNPPEIPVEGKEER